MNSDCVIIVGAGPVGLVASVSLIQNKIPVIVLEASADLAVLWAFPCQALRPTSPRA